MVIQAALYFTYDHLPEAAQASLRAPQSPDLGVFKQQVYLLSYYLDRPVAQISTAGQLRAFLEQGKAVLIAQGELKAAVDGYRSRRLRPLDMAKLGQLVLDQGRWKG